MMCKSSAARRNPVSPAQYRQEVTKKRWRMADLAVRWGMTPEHLSRLVANRDRPIHWDDALFGLPVLTRAEAAELRAQRLAEARRQAAARLPTSGKTGPGYTFHGVLVPGVILSARDRIGEMAEQGDECHVLEVLDDGTSERYVIALPRGQDTFSAEEVERYLCETGKSLEVSNG